MGYSTEFEGQFEVNPPLRPHHLAYLKAFSKMHHVQHDARIVGLLPDPLRKAVGLPVGVEGEYFVNPDAEAYHRAVLHHGRYPETQPGLNCDWTPTDDGTAIIWNGVEKFYNYVEWLEYLMKNFLTPWGYEVSGSVSWQGDDSDDVGDIFVESNGVIFIESNKDTGHEWDDNPKPLINPVILPEASEPEKEEKTLRNTDELWLELWKREEPPLNLLILDRRKKTLLAHFNRNDSYDSFWSTTLVENLTAQSIAKALGEMALSHLDDFRICLTGELISSSERDDDHEVIEIEFGSDGARWKATSLNRTSLNKAFLGQTIPEAIGWLLITSEVFDVIPEVCKKEEVWSVE